MLYELVSWLYNFTSQVTGYSKTSIVFIYKWRMNQLSSNRSDAQYVQQFLLQWISLIISTFPFVILCSLFFCGSIKHPLEFYNACTSQEEAINISLRIHVSLQ